MQWDVGGWTVGQTVDGGSVHVELGAEVMENLVGWRGETTSGSEGKVGGNEKIGEVFGVDFAGDGGVVAGRA